MVSLVLTSIWRLNKISKISKLQSRITAKLKDIPTRSYFSEGNSVSFPEIYSKSEKGWDIDILCMRSHGVWGDLCKCVALRALIRSWPMHFELYLLVATCDTSKCDNARGDRPHILYRHETYFVTF